MIRKQFGKNKVIYLTLLLFIILSAFLMTIGSCIILQTMDSMESMFSVANPPHFLQMHTGEIDREKIAQFAEGEECVSQYEIVEMLNLDGADLWYEKKGEKDVSLAESMLDNGFVRQTEHFDYLLDLGNNVIRQKNGEIGIPITYMQKYDMAVGDLFTIQTGNFSKTYRIANFVRDAQMASSMASSVRFLLSDEDFQELKGAAGEPEYIMEFLSGDSSQAGEIQKCYEAAGLPANGQGITYPLIKLINMLSSGLQAGAMILVSIILIFIAALNLYFTISAVIEEEIREIGAMKAIGISNQAIRKLYLKKYRILAGIGSGIGFVTGMISNRAFTKDIRLMLGDEALGIKAVFISVVAVLFVYWFMLHFCKRILKRIGKITVVQALVYGETKKAEKKREKALFPLERHCKTYVNLYLSLKSLVQKKKSWFLIVVVFFLAANVMLIPMNLLYTLKDKEFSSQMGNADCDLWMEIELRESMEEKCRELLERLEEDGRITNYGVFSTVRCETKAGGEREILSIQWGDYQKFPVACIEGNSPQNEGEIAISYLNQKKLEKNVGDVVELAVGGEKKGYKVVGIYQDITSGGYTAKAFHGGSVSPAQAYSIFADCAEKNEVETIAKEYGGQFTFAKILPTEEFTSQTFGSITDSFGSAAYACVVAALCIGTLIIVLFLKLQIAKEYSEAATLRILGFSQKDIVKQYVLKGGASALLGILFGILWCNTGCEKLVGALLSLLNFGIADFSFIVSPVFDFVICPVLLLLIAVGTSYLCAGEIKRHEIVKMLKE